MRPSKYRFVDIFHNQYRLSVPIPESEKSHQKYLPICFSEEEIHKAIIDIFKDHSISETDITYLMKGWPKKPYSSGYIGVSPRANLKVIGYAASYYKDNVLLKPKGSLIKLYPENGSNIIKVSKADLVSVFVKRALKLIS